MLFVPSSGTAVIARQNAVTDNDPDKFWTQIEYAQEMGMSHTKWHNPNGAMIRPQGYYNPQRHDVNANNEITARLFGLSHQTTCQKC